MILKEEAIVEHGFASRHWYFTRTSVTASTITLDLMGSRSRISYVLASVLARCGGKCSCILRSFICSQQLSEDCNVAEERAHCGFDQLISSTRINVYVKENPKS